MLQQLTIRNFAIIENLTLTFGSGLNVLTGETGAGKSLILDAIALVFGTKLPVKDFIREPRLTAVIETSLTLNTGEMIHLRRDITTRGSRFFINGQATDRDSVLPFQQLIDIHNQHELTGLFESTYQLQCLDAFGGNVHQAQLAQLEEAYQAFSAAKQAYQAFEESRQQWLQDQSRWTVQLLELEHHQLSDPQEDTQLKQQLDRLNHQHTLIQALDEASKRLKSSEKEFPGAIEQLQQVHQLLQQTSHWDASLTEVQQSAETVLSQLLELHDTVNRRLDEVDLDPQTFDQLSNRYSQLERLKRKTGKTLAALIEWQQRLRHQLTVIEDPTTYAEELQTTLQQTQDRFQHVCEEMTQRRLALGEVLEVELNKHLVALAMPNARFSIQWQRQSWTAKGQDRLMFMFSANRDQPLRPLAKVASGGELSRVLFALKRQLATTLGFQAMVLDEIDTGMSGETVKTLAEQLSLLSRHCQLIVVTHQPIVAAMADHHWHIRKFQDGQTTHVVTDQMMHKEKRLEVLSRLASGIDTDDEAVEKFIDRLLHNAVAWKSKQQNNTLLSGTSA